MIFFTTAKKLAQIYENHPFLKEVKADFKKLSVTSGYYCPKTGVYLAFKRAGIFVKVIAYSIKPSRYDLIAFKRMFFPPKEKK